MAEHKDTIAAIMGSASALAGLLLVFLGFVYARGEGYSNVNRGAKFKLAAKLGIIPFLTALVCTWSGMEWMEGNSSMYSVCVILFRITLSLTGLYGSIVTIWFL